MTVNLIILFVLFLLSAFFSSAETALTSIPRHRVLNLVDRKVPSANILKKLKESPSKFLSTVLIGNNLVNILASVMAAAIVFDYFKQWGEAVAISFASIAMTILILIFGEITPKTIAINNEKIALFSAWPIFLLSKILAPIGNILAFLCKPLIALFGGKIKHPFISEEEIKMILAAGEKEGVIEKGEKEMITSIFEFGETTAREVMTPRPDIQSLEVNQTIEDTIKLINQTGHSRIPVYEGNIDNIVGLVYAKDLLKEKGKTLKEYLRPVLFTPESKKIDELMHQMQAARTHMAIIVDEFGVASGIVALEDLVEEIFGEIQDEFEKGEKTIERISDNVWLIDARTSISDVNKSLEIELPETEGIDTVGGLIFSELGKMPSIGNSITINDFILSVEKVLKRRITRVKIKKIKPEDLDFVGG
jgi:putative hemolysin